MRSIIIEETLENMLLDYLPKMETNKTLMFSIKDRLRNKEYYFSVSAIMIFDDQCYIVSPIKDDDCNLRPTLTFCYCDVDNDVSNVCEKILSLINIACKTNFVGDNIKVSIHFIDNDFPNYFDDDMTILIKEFEIISN